MTPSILGPLATVLGLVIGLGAAWGTVRAHVEILRKEIDEIRKQNSEMPIFKTQIDAVCREIESIKSDMHHLLVEMAKESGRREASGPVSIR